jgi:hypothetical protein
VARGYSITASPCNGCRSITAYVALKAGDPAVYLIKHEPQARHSPGNNGKRCLRRFKCCHTLAPIDESEHTIGDELREYVFEMSQIFFKLMLRIGLVNIHDFLLPIKNGLTNGMSASVP